MFINDLIDNNVFYIDKPLLLLNAEWRWDEDKFLSLPKDKLIIVDCSSEHWGSGTFIHSVYDMLEKYNLMFLVLTHVPTDHLTRPNLLFYPYWYQQNRKSFPRLPLDNVKKYKLSCLNANPRPHRIYNYFALQDRNYNNVLLTMHNSDVHRDDEYKLSPTVLNKWKEISQTLPTRNSLQDTPGEDMNTSNHEAYSNSYINLVTETTVDNSIQITEKTWKPIAAGQLFIILGNPGLVAHLREIGVDVFDDAIDHSYYDSEPDVEAKIAKIYELLDSLMISNLEESYKQLQNRRAENVRKFFAGEFDSQYSNLLKRKIKECINTLN